MNLSAERFLNSPWRRRGSETNFGARVRWVSPVEEAMRGARVPARGARGFSELGLAVSVVLENRKK